MDAVVATNPHQRDDHARRRRRRGRLLGLAALVVVAAGVAWKLRPASAPSASGPDGAGTALPRHIAATTAPAAATAQAVARAPAAATTPPAEAALPADLEDVSAASDDAPAMMAPARLPSHAEPAVMQRAVQAAAPVPAAAAAGAAEGLEPPPVSLPVDNAVALHAAGYDQPFDAQPPASADSPEVQQAWLARIGELVEEEQYAAARASLAEYRRRYPGAPLPDGLAGLLE